MLAGDFARKLYTLNRKLRVYCGNDDSKPAGVFVLRDREPEEVCGVDKNFVPEGTCRAPNGLITKGGWRRVVRILIAKRLVDKDHAERVFGTPFGPRRSPRIGDVTDEFQKQFAEAKMRGFEKTGNPNYVEIDDMVDIGRAIRTLRGKYV